MTKTVTTIFSPAPFAGFCLTSVLILVLRSLFFFPLLFNGFVVDLWEDVMFHVLSPTII